MYPWGTFLGSPMQSIPWGVFQWAIEHPELGWVLLLIWLAVELRTRYGIIYQLDQKITGSIIVIRALAQHEEAIDEDKVDAYLAENGMAPQDFFRDGDEPGEDRGMRSDD